MIGREISLDTETTGLSPREGHRIVEIGCVEMINRIPTGNNYHVYINPDRDMPEMAESIHGLSSEFLSDKPLFSEVGHDFIDFIGTSRLIIHNASFDMKFINAELTHIGKRNIIQDRVFCTLKYARNKFPGSPASLDALCKRFNIDISSRTKHGALLDAELLAAMYLELMGGSQENLNLSNDKNITDADITDTSIINTNKIDKKTQTANIPTQKIKPRSFKISEEESKNHTEFVKKMSLSAWNS